MAMDCEEEGDYCMNGQGAVGFDVRKEVGVVLLEQNRCDKSGVRFYVCLVSEQQSGFFGKTGTWLNAMWLC